MQVNFRHYVECIGHLWTLPVQYTRSGGGGKGGDGATAADGGAWYTCEFDCGSAGPSGASDQGEPLGLQDVEVASRVQADWPTVDYGLFHECVIGFVI